MRSPVSVFWLNNGRSNYIGSEFAGKNDFINTREHSRQTNTKLTVKYQSGKGYKNISQVLNSPQSQGRSVMKMKKNVAQL